MLWKGRYRCAVTLSVDFDAETLWSGTFKLPTPSPLSRGDYDIRAGLPRILRLFEAHGIPATFMVPGQVIDDHPGACRDIRAFGGEVGHHGYHHESVLELPIDEERELMRRGDRPHRGGLRHPAPGQPVAAVRARPEHRGPARGERLRLRLEPVRPRRAVPAPRARHRRPAARPGRAARLVGARRRAVLPLLVLPVHVGTLDAVAGAGDLEGRVRRLLPRRRLLPARHPPVLHRPAPAHRADGRAAPRTSRASPTCGSGRTSRSRPSGAGCRRRRASGRRAGRATCASEARAADEQRRSEAGTVAGAPPGRLQR